MQNIEFNLHSYTYTVGLGISSNFIEILECQRALHSTMICDDM